MDLGVLTLVSLTSPPGLLYAIPVERLMPIGTAQSGAAGWVGLATLELRRRRGADGRG